MGGGAGLRDIGMAPGSDALIPGLEPKSAKPGAAPAQGADTATAASRRSAEPATKNKPRPHYAGHRDRLRQRFVSAGIDALADYELLELVLFRAIPRRDTKPLAKALIAKFGSIAEVLSAPRERLKEVDGVSDGIATDLHIVAAAGLRLSRDRAVERTLLTSWTAVQDYIRAAMAYETREQFRILFLDKRNGLIADEVQQRGTVDHTPVYIREVIARALQLSATAIVLVHNHPSGDPAPSRADIDMTRMIVSAAKPLGIVVHDHIIVGRQGSFSMKGDGLI